MIYSHKTSGKIDGVNPQIIKMLHNNIDILTLLENKKFNVDLLLMYNEFDAVKPLLD